MQESDGNLQRLHGAPLCGAFSFVVSAVGGDKGGGGVAAREKISAFCGFSGQDRRFCAFPPSARRIFARSAARHCAVFLPFFVALLSGVRKGTFLAFCVFRGRIGVFVRFCPFSACFAAKRMAERG